VPKIIKVGQCFTELRNKSGTYFRHSVGLCVMLPKVEIESQLRSLIFAI